MIMNELKSLSNLYGNPLASIDVETTGRVGGYHEIIQIAIVPMNMDLTIANVSPFNFYIKPEYPERAENEATRIHGIDIFDLQLNAPSSSKVLEYLIDWFKNLPISFNKRLTPLAHNWAFERSFLLPWMGPEFMDSIFTPYPRDTMLLANSFNDRAALIGAKIPFPNIGLKAMCRIFGIDHQQHHNSLNDAIVTAKLYSKMIYSSFR